MKQFLECGKILTTHGIKGEVKVQSWCDSPEYLCGFKTLYLNKGDKSLTIRAARPHKDMALLLIEGYDSIDAANRLRGQILYLDRNDAPDDGAPFLQDLIGLSVVDADTGMDYGKLADVIQTGANDVYLLRDNRGKERLIPAIPQVVLETDWEGGVMKIRPLEGLFDDAD